MMDVENQDTVKCTSNRVVEKDFSDNVEYRKSPQPFRSRAFRTLSDVLKFPSGGEGGFRFNHPNSLSFMPALALTYIKCIPKMDTFQATFSYVILLHRF